MDPLHKLALETIQMGKQALIFLPSRASAEKTAEDIAKLTQLNYPEFEKAILHAASTPTKQCRRLSHIIKKGIAFHHAGLLQKQKDLIEQQFKEGKIKIICATPTLCLSRDTQIWEDINETEITSLDNSSQLLALSSTKLVKMKVQKVEKNWNHSKLLEISSVSGYSIKVTPEHKMLVKRNNRKVILPASKITKRDKIATIGRITIEKEKDLELKDFVLENELLKNASIDQNLSYFIGLMLGDGYSGIEKNQNKTIYKGSPCIVGIDEEIFAHVKKICEQLGISSKRNTNFNGTPQVILGKNKWFREFMLNCGIEKRDKKNISDKLMTMNKENTAALLRGLFDTDGYVEKRGHIGFSNISHNLVKKMQKLLLRFGIVCRIRQRKEATMQIYEKEYSTVKYYELLIAQKKSIIDFYNNIGFNINRKHENLRTVIKKINKNIHYSECKRCDYKIYTDLFSGRTKNQKSWGTKKIQVIKVLGKNKETGSRALKSITGFEPKKKESRLNHHYELIQKRKIGEKSKTEWFWSLNIIGEWIYSKLISENKEINEFFKLRSCPLCEKKLNVVVKSSWRSSDFESDIFWDKIREMRVVPCEEYVYDVVLPDEPKNNHMFVANGFIVHNSAGVDLPAYRVIIKSLKRYSGGWGMNWIPVLEYLQMAGRAGRPRYETEGQAILIAKNEHEKEEIYNNYICGVPEEIYSKLAVEPVLRTYLLSLISSGIIRDETSMTQFFAKTFWAHQFKDMERLQNILEKMLLLLEEWKFINISKDKTNSDFISASSLSSSEKKMRPTFVGKRISELYLDPLTARHLLDCLEQYNSSKIEFSLLQMISHTLEMRPLLRLKAKQHDNIQEELMKNYEYLLEKEPSAFDSGYHEFLESIKTALFFNAWINELDEDYLFETYDIRPGEIRIKLETADWLLYACKELCKILDHQYLRDIRKLRIRVKNGVKEQLLPLLRLKGIGRIRARKLFSHGLKDLGDIKKADLTTLTQILGRALAEDVKKQLGEEIKEIPKGTRKGQLSINRF